MSRAAGNLYHPTNKYPEPIYGGFSWPAFFFGPIYCFYKGMWGFGFVYLLMASFTGCGVGAGVALGGGSPAAGGVAGLLLSPIAWIVLGFMVNEQYRRQLLRQGYFSVQQAGVSFDPETGRPMEEVKTRVP